MQKYWNTVQDERGNPRYGASVSVQQNGINSTIYTDSAGLIPAANPLTTDSTRGYFEFYAAAGTYDLVIFGVGFTSYTITAGANLGLPSGDVTFTQSGTGAVARTVQAKERDIVSVKDFGAVGDGVTDDTAAIQAAITAVGSRGGVYFPQPSSSYLVTSQITISGGGITLFGWNQAGSQILFKPTAAATLFKFTSGGSTTIAQSGIIGLRLIATGETTYVKKAIVVVDGEEIELGNISIASWSDTTHSSVGFELQGRQAINCHDITVNCDIPFSLKDTPNTALVSCDHFRFWNIYATAHSSQPVWTVASDVWLTNCTWDGYQAWAIGSYGFYWDASAAANTSYNVRFANVRWEQSTNATGYMLYINPKAFSTSLNIENCYSDANHRGYYLRGFVSGGFKGCTYAGTGIALDVASAGVVLTLQDNFFNQNAGATISSTGFTGAWINNDSATSNTADGNILANIITALTAMQVTAGKYGSAANHLFAGTGTTDALRILHGLATAGASLEAVDYTGVSAYAPLKLGGSTAEVTIAGTRKLLVDATGAVTLASLAGVGSRTVVADANGKLSAP